MPIKGVILIRETLCGEGKANLILSYTNQEWVGLRVEGFVKKTPESVP